MTMFDRIGGMIWFVDALRFLASRLDVPFDELANQVGALNQPGQVAAKIRQLVDSLPLPDTLPPAEIGTFRRIDCIAEVRELAKKWQNCLAEYVLNINDGTSAVYLSERLQAVCFLVRQGRIGWLLLQTKGPKNIDIEPDRPRGNSGRLRRRRHSRRNNQRPHQSYHSDLSMVARRKRSGRDCGVLRMGCNVRYCPIVTKLLRRSEMTRCAKSRYRTHGFK
jgi:hypothetical protein